MKRRFLVVSSQSGRPALLYALIACLVFLGVGALAGGWGLTADPSGANLGFSTEWLSGSPFPDFLIPGLFLLLALGVAPLAAAVGLWRGARWAWRAALLISVALIAWIVVETMVIGYWSDPPLQLIFGALGVLMLALTSSPQVRRRTN
jgi:hypothetical protein